MANLPAGAVDVATATSSATMAPVATMATATSSAAPAWLYASGWGWPQYLGFFAAVQVGFELYVKVLPQLFARGATIARRGKHLDVLAPLDRAFIALNRQLVLLMTYHYLQHLAHSPRIPWELAQLSAANTLLGLPACFVLYDATYVALHRLLHVRALYPWIHKHHHRQIVPTRGNTDAINVHPVEFLLGEYNHLLAVWAASHLLGSLHALTCVVFIFAGGVFASLNHTRFDVRLRVGRALLFDVRAHDIHHRLPRSNYGQYLMLWDWLSGSYRGYEETLTADGLVPEERAKPKAS